VQIQKFFDFGRKTWGKVSFFYFKNNEYTALSLIQPKQTNSSLPVYCHHLYIPPESPVHGVAGLKHVVS
jgi:hypothetical protein